MNSKRKETTALKQQYTEIFEKFLHNYSDFPEILEIARRNAYDMGRGSKIWIIGGFVYRPIIKELYGEIKEPSQIDVDILIERAPASQEPYLPRGWERKVTESGFPYMEKKDESIRIDLNYLLHFPSIMAKFQQVPLEMKHFFRCTPLNVQAIAYRLTGDKKRVIGNLGVLAIRDKIVRINNLDAVVFEVEKNNRGITGGPKMSVERYVLEKAAELKFSCELQDISSHQSSISEGVSNGPRDISPEEKVGDETAKEDKTAFP